MLSYSKLKSLHLFGSRHIYSYSRLLINKKDDDYVPPTISEPKGGLKILKAEIKGWTEYRMDGAMDLIPIPRESDIVIVGGGLVGTMMAHLLGQRAKKGAKVVVIEKDLSLKNAASLRSFGGLTHQFSNVLNTKMAIQYTKFLRELRTELYLDGFETPDIDFNQQGCLTLTGDEHYEDFRQYVNNQRTAGADIDLLTTQRLQEKFPFLDLDGVKAGSYGLSGEGWYDPQKLLARLRLKCQERGVDFIQGKVVGFRHEMVKTVNDSGEYEDVKCIEDIDVLHVDDKKYPIRFAACICCAGAKTPDIFKMAGIGYDSHIHAALGVPLPIKPRKRHTFLVHNPSGPGLSMPAIVDTSGLMIRREGIGGHYLVSYPGEIGSIGDYSIDYDFYDQTVKPLLINRFPLFANSTLQGGWTHYEALNVYDQNLVVGNHPYHRNFFSITGGAQHSIQQAYSAAYYIADEIVEMRKETLDLSELAFDRFIEFTPLTEKMLS